MDRSYGFWNWLKNFAKIAVIVLIFLAIASVAGFYIWKYDKEKKANAKLIWENAELNTRIAEAEKKLAEQNRVIEDLTTTIIVEEKPEESSEKPEASSLDTEQILEQQINLLKNGDTDTIRGWFGLGADFTSKAVMEATRYARITVIDDKKAPEGYLAIHVCNVDYRKLMEARKELYNSYLKKNVAMNDNDRNRLINELLEQDIRDKKFDKHYKVYVTSNNGVLEITEDLKQAVTGGWYLGIGEELPGYRCIYD